MAIVDQIIGAESGGRARARNPRSSAYGSGQFLNRTWLDVIQRHRPDLAQGRSVAEILELRSDPQISREMTEAFAGENRQFLARHGINPTPGNTYLAHFAGPEGARSVHASPDQPVEQILGRQVVDANPFLRGKTGADLIRWADRKMVGSGNAQPAKAVQPSTRRPSENLPGDVTNMVNTASPQQGTEKMFDLSSIMSGLGGGSGYGKAAGSMASAIPSLGSAADGGFDINKLFGSMSQLNTDDDAQAGASLAANAQSQAAQPMGQQQGAQRAPVNMQNLMQMLANSGRIGVPSLRRVAQMGQAPQVPRPY